MRALSCREEERLSAIHSLGILDSLPEPQFDAVVHLARDMFDVPISTISVLDRDRQWFKAKSGIEAQETDRGGNCPIEPGAELIRIRRSIVRQSRETGPGALQV